MPTPYVRKLAKKHGVSTSTAEKHWAKAKAAAKKEGHDEDYAYVTGIFKNMMHESAFIPTLKDLTRGMTFKYFLVAEADGEGMEKQFSPEYNYMASNFPQFVELPFKARRDLEKEIKRDGILDGYEALSQDEKDSIHSALHDMVIDKMQDTVGTGINLGDWKGEKEYQDREQLRHDIEDFDDDEAPRAAPEKKQRMSSGPRHIAAMRHQNLPVDEPAVANAAGDEGGPAVKSYYKSWAALSPEQRAARSALAKKHGTIYRVKTSKKFRLLPPEKQEAIINALKSGSSLGDAYAAAGVGGAGPTGE